MSRCEFLDRPESIVDWFDVLRFRGLCWYAPAGGAPSAVMTAAAAWLLPPPPPSLRKISPSVAVFELLRERVSGVSGGVSATPPPPGAPLVDMARLLIIIDEGTGWGRVDKR